MKKKILMLFVLILSLSSLSLLFLFGVNAEETVEPMVSIEKFNLVFDDNVYLKYAVKFDGVDDADITAKTVGMLYFTEPRRSCQEHLGLMYHHNRLISIRDPVHVQTSTHFFA